MTTRSGFLLAEDAALKDRLTGLIVTDDKNASRPVKVFFRYPETETEKQFPFITIEMVGMTQSRQLQHSERTLYYSHPDNAASVSINSPNYIGYLPSELDSSGMQALLNGDNQQYLRMEAPIPVELVYQISTYTRSALHDRQLTSYILRNVLPFRSNALLIPADGTVRRLDLLGWQQADMLDTEAGLKKRIFRKVYTLQINAEIPRENLTLVKQVTSVVATINGIEDETPEPNPSLSEAF